MMFREKILSQIQVILESVQSIVSQLQHVSQDPNEEQLWWDCQDVQLQCQSISPDNIHEWLQPYSVVEKRAVGNRPAVVTRRAILTLARF